MSSPTIDEVAAVARQCRHYSMCKIDALGRRSSLRVDGFNSFCRAGGPLLPHKVYELNLPPQAALDSISLEVTDLEVLTLPGTYQLELCSTEVFKTNGDEPVPVVPTEDGFVRLRAPGQQRSRRFARLELLPFAWDADSGVLRVATRMSVTISYGLRSSPPPHAWLRSAGAGGERKAGRGYVVITTNAIEAGSTALADFCAHKQGRVFTVQVITEDEYGVLTGQAPDGTAEKIRRWLQDNAAAAGIEYVLLIGNPDPDDPSSPSDSVGDVPMKMCPVSEYYEAPTDYYYADLTGNWDLDGDQLYCEWEDDTAAGGVDLAYELVVGRIPVHGGDYATLDAILTKMIDYETETMAGTGAASWRRNVLLPMSFIKTYYDGAALARQMKIDYLDAGGFTTWTQYQQGNGACGLDSGWDSDEELRGGTVVRDRWAAEDYGLVVWFGHGAQTYTVVGPNGCQDGNLFSASSAAYLDDDHPSFVFQVSCFNGYPENPGNLQYALLTNGAVVNVAATREGYEGWPPYFPGWPSPSGIAYGYTELLVAGWPGGDALYETKAGMVINERGAFNDMLSHNLYGDPSLVLVRATSIFADGFESGDLTQWPVSVP